MLQNFGGQFVTAAAISNKTNITIATGNEMLPP